MGRYFIPANPCLHSSTADDRLAAKAGHMQTLSTQDIKPKKFTSRTIGDKETEQIVRLNGGGYYAAEIADLTGRTAEQIESALWNEGYAARTHKYEAAEVAGWCDMYTGKHDGLGMCFAEIARQTGYCARTIQLALLRAGLRDRHPTESRRLAGTRRRQSVKH